MQYLTDLFELEILNKGDHVTVPILGRKFELEIVAFKPNSAQSIQVRKWTEFRILRKDSLEIDHSYDPAVEDMFPDLKRDRPMYRIKRS